MASNFYEDELEFQIPASIKRCWYESLLDVACFVLVLLSVGSVSFFVGRIYCQFEAVQAGAGKFVNDQPKKEFRFEFIKCQ